MKNTITKGIVTAFLFVSVLAVMSSVCRAETKTGGGAKVYSLDTDKVYKQYDVTGDGKPDRFRIKTDKDSQGYIGRLSVYVNRKSCLKKTYTKSNDPVLRAYVQAKLIRLKNKKTLLYIHFSTYNGYYAGGWVYEYKNGKMKLRLETKNIIYQYARTHAGSWRAYETLYKVTGNTLIFESGSYTTKSQRYRYKYKKGKLKAA